MEIIENPVIERIERYGYIKEPKTWTCPVCGNELQEGDRVWSEGCQIVVCEHCLEDLRSDEAAEFFERWDA